MAPGAHKVHNTCRATQPNTTKADQPHQQPCTPNRRRGRSLFPKPLVAGSTPARATITRSPVIELLPLRSVRGTRSIHSNGPEEAHKAVRSASNFSEGGGAGFYRFPA